MIGMSLKLDECFDMSLSKYNEEFLRKLLPYST